jgi:hypothetical protein
MVRLKVQKVVQDCISVKKKEKKKRAFFCASGECGYINYDEYYIDYGEYYIDHDYLDHGYIMFGYFDMDIDTSTTTPVSIVRVITWCP